MKITDPTFIIKEALKMINLIDQEREGWIPVVGGKCPIFEMPDGTKFEYKTDAGRSYDSGILRGGIDATTRGYMWHGIVAVRLIKQPTKIDIPDSPALLNAAADTDIEQLIFEGHMRSFELKRKAKRDARTLRNVVPPIGMAAMMVIAG